ncbi:hypothetical protein AGMMS50262_06460 [Bacteroidia bacterium]|nr:hypothetical protein AGMMS50262_06460 [Bacteroidia bacterium]
MKRYILFSLFCLCLYTLQAQDTRETAVNIGTKTAAFTYTNTLNTTSYTDKFTTSMGGKSTNDVFYKFTLSKPMEVVISHCGSSLSDTYLHLLDALGNRIAYNDDYSGTGACSQTMNSYLKRLLTNGTYYVVSEGYSANGSITTSVTGTIPLVSSLPYYNLGTLSTSAVSGSCNLSAASATNYYAGLNNNDTIHRFTLSSPMEVTLSHSGSQSGVTSYLYLFNSASTLIATNSNYGGSAYISGTQHALLKKILPAGTYYVVSECVPNGTIKLNYSGNNQPFTDAGTFNDGFIYTNTQNTTNTANFYSGQAANDVRYKFTVNKNMEVVISHCGSEVADTYLSLLNSSGSLIASDDNYTGDGQCNNSNHAYMRKSLTAGSYYVISEGKGSANGNITTTIQGISPSVAASNTSAFQNWIKTRTYASADGSYYNDVVEYYDGLGRPFQQVQIGVTPSRKDLITWQEYDACGRDSTLWLPVINSGNPGSYLVAATFKSRSSDTYSNTNYNVAADSKPYSKSVYESSPLNRITQQYGPGNAWHTNLKAVKTEYLANTAGDSCALYTLTGNSVKKEKNYDAGSLFVTKITDEDGKIAYEFKDKLDRVVLQRQMDGSNKHDTYFVYDDFNRLCFVLPPAAADAMKTVKTYALSENAIIQYAYYYRYDERSRCITKRLPGADSICYRYDKADRLIFTQDGEMRQKGQWFYSIPDTLGRVVLEGYCTVSTPPALSSLVAASFAGTNNNYFGYTVSGFSLPQSGDILNVYYYDNYRFKNLSDFGTAYNYAVPSGFNATRYGGDSDLISAKGLLTGSLTLKFDDYIYLGSAFYYDSKGRLIQSVTDNHLSGYEKEYVNYNFTGQPTRRQIVHSSSNGSVSQIYRYFYDHAGRKTLTKYQVDNNQEVTFSEFTYDELGRLSKKKLLGSLQAIDYKYNIRNWLKSIVAPAFKEYLSYNENGLYNGNISALTWNSYYNSSTRGYNFTYDGLNRMTRASFSPDGLMDEGLVYDKMGNITALRRYSSSYTPKTVIDSLTLEYTGNQLKKITEAATSSIYGFVKPAGSVILEYSYNKNGAMKYDFNGGIANISYNCLNLPDKITFRQGHMTLYGYDAKGQKRQTKHITVRNQLTVAMGNADYTVNSSNVLSWLTTDYCAGGSIIYEDNALKMVRTEEGYLTKNSNGTYNHYFYIKDHLGNNRATVYSSSGSSWLLGQETNYYPFGMAYPTGDYYPEAQPFKFGDKELDEMNGLNWYDFEARHLLLNPPVFPTQDPLAEKFYWISPYTYCLNNPVNKIDPTGLAPIYAPDGTFLGTDNEGLRGNPIVMSSDYFTQGMMHNDAVGYYTVLNDEDARTKLSDHYGNLSNRPDYDGFVTISEGIEWAKAHPGAKDNPSADNTLYIDVSKLDFGNISTANFTETGVETPINLFNIANTVESSDNPTLRATVYALGRITMKLENRENKTVSIVNNSATDYDWNRGGGGVRDNFIRAERKRAGLNDSHGFKVFYYGVGKLRK